jgi:hypothetical protein
LTDAAPRLIPEYLNPLAGWCGCIIFRASERNVMSNERRGRGRPPSASRLDSARVNYQALAWQVKQQIDNAKAEGKKIKIRDAVEREMRASAAALCAPYSRVEAKFETAYAEVRKILKEWKGGGKL